MNKILKWSEKYQDEYSVDTIKKLFPKSDYRVSPSKFPSGAKIAGAMRSGNCYVMSGTCTYSFNDNLDVSLIAGEFVKLPKGEYLLQVTSKQDLEIVLVWELSELLT